MSWKEHRVKKSAPSHIRKGHQLSYLAEQCSQVFPQPDPLAMPCQEQQPQACSSRSLLKEHFIKVFYFTFRERLLFALHKPVIGKALQTVGEAVASAAEGCSKLWKAWNAECTKASYAFYWFFFFQVKKSYPLRDRVHPDTIYFRKMIESEIPVMKFRWLTFQPGDILISGLHLSSIKWEWC